MFRRRTFIHVSLVSKRTQARHNGDEDPLYIDLVVDNVNSENEWTQTCNINRVDINFKLDSGAQVSILPERLLRRVTDAEKLRSDSK